MTEEAHRRWQLRLRRAFRVPDLITHDHARRVIAYELTRATDLLGESAAVGVGEKLFDAFLELAVKGDIDDEILEGDQRPALSIHPAPDRIYDAGQRVLQQSGIRNVDNRTSKMVDRLLDTVRGHVLAWPIEHRPGEYGRWFDEG